MTRCALCGRMGHLFDIGMGPAVLILASVALLRPSGILALHFYLGVSLFVLLERLLQ
jgi:hypothetical protein